MAVGFDKSKLNSLVIFNEVIPLYAIGDDIECRFYVDPSLDISSDKIGLFKVGWGKKNDFIVIKEVRDSDSDEFDERRLFFSANELPTSVDQEYQFCYFHEFNKKYLMCGTSANFRFYNSIINEDLQHRSYTSNPNAPELPLYPTLKAETNINQTFPKRTYDMSPEDMTKNLTNGYQKESQCSNKSFEYLLADKERELTELKQMYDKHNRNQLLEIERLKDLLKANEKKYSLLESKLSVKNKSGDNVELIKMELMDTIKLTEAKNSSLEEQLLTRERDLTKLNEKYSEQETIIDELTAKLAISHSELDLYRTVESKDTVEQIKENRLLRDKLKESLLKYEKVVKSNEILVLKAKEIEKNKLKIDVELEYMREQNQSLKNRLEKAEDSKIEITAQLRANQILMKNYANHMESSYMSPNDPIVKSRHIEPSVTIYVNEMQENMKEFAISQSSKALKLCNDIKSIAESIVSAFDELYGNSWHCFVGENFDHNSLLHVFGTYISFSLDELKIILYKTIDSFDFCSALKSSQTNKNVEIIYKNECTDTAFEALITSLALESINENFVNYSQLSSHLTKLLKEKYCKRYGYNWLVVVGNGEHFDSNFQLINRRYIELQIGGSLKIIVLQIDESIPSKRYTNV